MLVCAKVERKVDVARRQTCFFGNGGKESRLRASFTLARKLVFGATVAKKVGFAPEPHF